MAAKYESKRKEQELTAEKIKSKIEQLKQKEMQLESREKAILANNTNNSSNSNNNNNEKIIRKLEDLENKNKYLEEKLSKEKEKCSA